jgi:hypothetical protein
MVPSGLELLDAASEGIVFESRGPVGVHGRRR